MRPSKIVRSSSSHISAWYRNPLCLFSIEARGRDYQYEITGISPHSCQTSNVVPRVRRAKASHLSLAAQTFIQSAVNVKCSGKGGAGTSNTIQSACAAATGVHVSTRQILRRRRSNWSSSTIDPMEALRKLQILPGVLQELQEKLPQLLAILTTTEISPQLHQPAARAFDWQIGRSTSISNVVYPVYFSGNLTLFNMSKITLVIVFTRRTQHIYIALLLHSTALCSR